jgi:hypothetical protein
VNDQLMLRNADLFNSSHQEIPVMHAHVLCERPAG